MVHKNTINLHPDASTSLQIADFSPTTIAAAQRLSIAHLPSQLKYVGSSLGDLRERLAEFREYTVSSAQRCGLGCSFSLEQDESIKLKKLLGAFEKDLLVGFPYKNPVNLTDVLSKPSPSIDHHA